MLIDKVIHCSESDEDDDDELAKAAIGDVDALDAVLRASRCKLQRARDRALQNFVRDASSVADNGAKCVTIPNTTVEQLELAT